jgi:hypothetical protein
MSLLKRKPAFQLSGLLASPDGLYDGSFLSQCALWWDHELQQESKLGSIGCRPFTSNDLARLRETVQPDNRVAFAAVADGVSIPGRTSQAVLSLAYAFALVIEHAMPDADSSLIGVQSPKFTADDLTELGRHYSEEGWAREFDQWAPFWKVIGEAFPSKIGDRLVAALRRAFDDQVDRWSAAENLALRKSIGAPDFSLISAEPGEGVRFHNFVELLFEWGGRLRLGENILSSGDDLRDHRFTHEPGISYTDHLFDEAYARYIEIARLDTPVKADVERAAIIWSQTHEDAAATSDHQELILTAVIRGYIWRSVENGPVSFVEPQLSAAVATSRSVGDHRSADEPLSVTLYYAALQQMIDGVRTPFGSIGGMLEGPKNYEKAYFATTRDFPDYGIEIEEADQRQAFQFGACLADAERVLTASPEAST